ncbi:hypothetical protein E2C01_011770 [Portunus trituberculatus]|uniref:Uncharacterized protein n=1 Tax=Portunus trituberculatus TaxID=210409 RepID=A0A5B7DCV3_PORTR|nr:hypothetical protein [Portunus trituberculatus]
MTCAERADTHFSGHALSFPDPCQKRRATRHTACSLPGAPRLGKGRVTGTIWRVAGLGWGRVGWGGVGWGGRCEAQTCASTLLSPTLSAISSPSPSPSLRSIPLPLSYRQDGREGMLRICQLPTSPSPPGREWEPHRRSLSSLSRFCVAHRNGGVQERDVAPRSEGATA